MKNQSKQKKVAEALSKLEVNEYINVYAFIVEHWSNYDFFIRRSFDVYLSQARKQYSDRVFETKKGLIKRLK